MVGRARRTLPAGSESPMSLSPESNPDPAVAEVGYNLGLLVVVVASEVGYNLGLVPIVVVVAK